MLIAKVDIMNIIYNICTCICKLNNENNVYDKTTLLDLNLQYCLWWLRKSLIKTVVIMSECFIYNHVLFAIVVEENKILYLMKHIYCCFYNIF